MTWEDVGRVLGPAVFGLVAGGLYGFATVMMEKPMQEGTSGWTESGKRLVLTQRVASHGSMGAALLTIADENAVPTAMLRKVLTACEQLLAMQSQADHVAYVVETMGDEGAAEIKERMTQGMDEADFVTRAARYRDIALSLLTNGMAEQNIPMSLEGVPHSPSLRHSTSVIVHSLHDILLNISIAVRKWRG